MREALHRAPLVAGVAAVILAGCGEGGEETTTAAGGCRQADQPAPKRIRLKPPSQEVSRGEKLTAVIGTSCGRFEIALDSKRSPKTVNSFVYLARDGFYDGLTFHRIVTDFVVQGGDPAGSGEGGPGYHVEEAPPPNLAYTEGVVAMAKSPVDPPGRSGSQFFVVIVPDAGLPPQYALLGRVSSGLDVVEKIGEAGTRSEAGRPRQTVLIDSVQIERG